MPESVEKPSAPAEHEPDSLLNGIVGVGAAIITDEVVGAVMAKGLGAGVAAAVVGGAVVYALDHTDLEKTIGEIFEPAPMSDCLPITDVASQVIETILPPVCLPDSGFPGDGINIHSPPFNPAADWPPVAGANIIEASDLTSPATVAISQILHNPGTIIDPADGIIAEGTGTPTGSGTIADSI